MHGPSESARSVQPIGVGLGAPARVNRSARIRGDNLAAVLQLVHHEGRITRSELTRRLGLNRSTVAALVADLVRRRLVRETKPPGGGGVGRPSPVVASDQSTVALSVNPEVDAVSIAVVALGGTVVDRWRHVFESVPTPAEVVEVTADRIRLLLEEAGDRYRVVGIGVAVPGLVDSSTGVVRLAPHLRWKDEPVGAMLAEATGIPVRVANDATLGATAERIFGGGRGQQHMVYINGGASGIGGGIIAGGLALGGSNGFAGEIGHTFVSPEAMTDPSGSPGSLETRVSRRRLLDLLAADVSAHPDVDEFDRALLASTDPAVLREVDSQLGYLAISVANIVNLLNPDLVVLGGFLASLDASRPDALARLVADRALPQSTRDLRIVPAQLGSSLLMIGAAELAFAALLADPSTEPIPGEDEVLAP